jgi:hypothetical protein
MVNMKVRLRTGPQGHVYLPEAVREILGKEITLLPNSEAAVLYPKDADLKRVIRSLRIIISDLELQATPIQKQQETADP